MKIFPTDHRLTVQLLKNGSGFQAVLLEVGKIPMDRIELMYGRHVSGAIHGFPS